MHSVLWGSPTLAAAWKRKVRSQHQRWGHWLFLGGLCSESTKKVSPVSTEQYFCLVGAHGPPWAVVHSSVPSCTKPALRFLTQLWAPALPLRPISALPPGGWSWREKFLRSQFAQLGPSVGNRPQEFQCQLQKPRALHLLTWHVCERVNKAHSGLLKVLGW